MVNKDVYIGSCQSAATSEIVKALLVTSLTHVSGAITSVQSFTFTFTFTFTFYTVNGKKTNRFIFFIAARNMRILDSITEGMLN